MSIKAVMHTPIRYGTFFNRKEKMEVLINTEKEMLSLGVFDNDTGQRIYNQIRKALGGT